MAASSSAALCGDLSNVSCARRSFQKCHLTFTQKQRFHVFPEAQKRKVHCPLVIRPVLNKLKSDISNGDNETSEPATVPTKRVVARTENLEKIKKEEDLQDAAILNRTKDLECQEREIAAANANHEKMEEDLKKANTDLASRSREIESLKILVEQQGEKISNSDSALTLKECEMDKLRSELTKKNEEATLMSSELSSKEQMLNKADELVKEQEANIQELQRVITEKEHESSKSLQPREKEERLKLVKANLEKQTVEWLSAGKEFKELTDQVKNRLNDVKGTSEDFERVRTLVADVMSELIITQKSLSSSCRKIEGQAFQFDNQLAELNEDKVLLMSLRETLRHAQEELQSEKNNVRAARAKCNKLESQLSTKAELFKNLQDELKREHSLLEQQSQGIAFLQKELQQKSVEYDDARNLLQVTEYELAEARLQIQHMKSEQASDQLLMQEQDSALLDAQKELAEVNLGIAELQRLLNSLEELNQGTTRIRKKEEYVSTMQDELDDKRDMFSEGTSNTQRISQLTDELVTSAKDEEGIIRCWSDEGNESKHDSDLRKQEDLETELETVKGLLREKDKEFLATQSALALKDEEFRVATQRWNNREEESERSKEELHEDSNGAKKVSGFDQEMTDAREEETERSKEELREDANGVKKASGLDQETTGDQSMRELATEKVQHGTTQSEAEAAITALQRLAEMTDQIAAKTDYSSIEEVEKEVARILDLTAMTLKQAGIGSTYGEQQ